MFYSKDHAMEWFDTVKGVFHRMLASQVSRLVSMDETETSLRIYEEDENGHKKTLLHVMLCINDDNDNAVVQIGCDIYTELKPLYAELWIMTECLSLYIH